MSLFPSPLIKVDLEGAEAVKTFFYNEVATDTTGDAQLLHYHSGDNVFSLYAELAELKLAIEQAGRFVYQQLLNHRDDVGVRITSAWFNLCQPGSSQLAHSHANSLLSGTFYLHTDAATKIEFYHPLSANSTHAELYDEPDNRPNAHGLCFHKRQAVIPVSTGDCLFWPSQLRHGYHNNQTADRLSLSFNMLPAEFNTTYQMGLPNS